MKRSAFVCLAILWGIASQGVGLAQQQWDPTDTDGDTLPDAWEIQFFGNLSYGAQQDPDGDSVPNGLEFSSGRNPMLAETQSGVPDWQGVPGALRMERWNDAPGMVLEDFLNSPRYLSGAPSQYGLVTSAASQQNQGDNYALRLRGTLIAPVTGQYRFYLSGDDQTRLYLGTDASRFSERMICRVDRWTPPAQWTYLSNQSSEWISLVAGQEYAFEAWMKEATGSDHLMVGWQMPDAPSIQVIPGRMADGTVVLRSVRPDPLDVDDDGLPDAWETAQGLNPSSKVDHAWRDLDGDGFSNLAEYQTSGSALASGGNVGFCEWEQFSIPVPTLRIADLTLSPKFAQAPASRGYYTSFESAQNVGNYFGRRMRAVVTIPTTGVWKFYISGDDACSLWVNPAGVSRFGKKQMANVSAATAFRAFTVLPNQQSRALTLNAGDQLYVEALHVEAGGSDYCSVAWTGPGYASPTVIPGSQLSLCRPEMRMEGGDWVPNDVDGDSLPDDWEAAHGLSVTQSGNQAMLHGEYGDPDQDGLTNFQEYQAGTNPLTAAGVSGKWFHEVYTDIGGSRVLDLIGKSGVLRASDFVRLADSTEDFQNYSDYYGQRFRATIKAPVTGDYTFWISGDDGAELWLSSDDRKFSKRRIAGIDDVGTDYGYSAFRDWDRVPGQRSEPVMLEAGKSYYVEVLHKEAAGKDHVSIGWRFDHVELPGGYLPTSEAKASLLFPGLQLADITQVSGMMNGGWILANQAVSGYLFTPGSTTTATCQLQFYDGTYTKVAKIQFKQTPAGVVAWQLSARYKAGLYLGADFDNLAGSSAVTPGATCYGVTGLTLVNAQQGVAAWGRNVLPSAVLTSFVRDADDLDDDALMDSWEQAHGLSQTDNGYTDPNQGEYGDPDGDLLINRVEWQLQTDPMNADTDGDGYTDGQEVYFLGTNPLVPEMASPSVVGEVAVEAQVAASGAWVRTADEGMLSIENRGWVDYEVSISTEGYYLFEIKGRARGSAILSSESFPLDLYVDSRKAASAVLISMQGQQGLTGGFAGWLKPGKHTLRVWNRNLLARRALQLDSIRLVKPSGADVNGNGLADWIEDKLTSSNWVSGDRTGSYASPLCLEGVSRDWTATELSVAGSALLPVQKGAENGWFANIPLSAQQAQEVRVSFENGLLEQTVTLEWLPLNLAAQPELTIRKQDSLRITAHTPGLPADATPVTLSLNGQLLGTTPANQPLIYQFQTPGVYQLAASWVGSSGAQSATCRLEVLAADFGPVLPIYLNRSRLWTPPLIANSLTVEGDRSLQLAAQATTNGLRTFLVDTSRLGTNTVLARTSPQGPVIATGSVEGILLSHTSNYEIPVLYTYPNGDRIVELSVFASSLPPGGSVSLEVWLGGRLFLPSGTTSVRLSAADFDESGIARVRMLLSSGIGTTCHRTYLYAADGKLIGQM